MLAEPRRDPGEVLADAGDVLVERAAAADVGAEPRFSSTDSSAKVPRPSGTCATPSRATDSGPRRPSGLPSKRIWPLRLTVPEIDAERRRLAGAVRAEDGDDLPLLDGERDPVERAHRAVARLDVAQLEQRHWAVPRRCRGTPRSRPGSPAPRPASPRRSSAEVHHVHVVGDPHHEVHVVLDEEHGQLPVVADLLDEAAELVHLLVVEPAGGLVEEQQLRLRRRGRARARRASASRTAARRRAAARSRRGRRSRAPRAPPPRRRRPRVCAPTRTLSSTVIVLNSSTFWKVRAIPRRTIPCTGVFSSVSPAKSDVALVRRVQPRDHVERGRLAGAVRADQADDLALRHVERDPVEGDDPAEPASDVPQREQGHRPEELIRVGAPNGKKNPPPTRMAATLRA